MSEIDEVLTHLLDGQWHDLLEVGKALQMRNRRLKEIVTFLRDFGLVKADLPRVKIAYDTKKFLESLREREDMRLHEINTSVSS